MLKFLLSKKKGIAHVRLNTILRKLWKDEIMGQDEVRELIDEIEEKDSLVVTEKKSILS